MQQIFWSIEKQNEFTEKVRKLSLPEIRRGFIKAYQAFKDEEKRSKGNVGQECRERLMKASIYFQEIPTNEQPFYQNIASESWLQENCIKPIIRNR